MWFIKTNLTNILTLLAVKPLEVGVERDLVWVGVDEVRLHHVLAVKHLKVGVVHVHDWLGVDEVQLLHYLAIKPLGDVLTGWTVYLDRMKLLRAFGKLYFKFDKFSFHEIW